MSKKLFNAPDVKLAIVAVSRDCFPESLSVNRRKALVKAYTEKYGADDIYECPICIVESEIHMQQALADIKAAGCNALCVYLGNFGPEISETMLAQQWGGPVMFCAAAEESQNDLVGGRGDAYCGMLNASYNLKIRGVNAYIPEYPVGNAEECADMINEFIPVARALDAMKNLKIISFGPRPQNFFACNAPIEPLYRMGVEIEENSELDLFEAFKNHEGDERIPAKVAEMEAELGAGNKRPEVLEKLAQYELTLLDINNSVPADMYKEAIDGKFPYTHKDTFMGFHCGNTASSKLAFCEMKYQKIMARNLPIECTNGTLEGDIAPGKITFFRLQSTADAQIRAYIAEGEVLDVRTKSFGAIGVFAIPEMGRFYRHVLIEKNYPHHGAVAFGNFGKTLYEVFKYLGVEDIGFNQPKGMLYKTENPFA